MTRTLMPKRYNNEVILSYGDTHFPYEHKDTFNFLAEVKDIFKPDRIVCTGDLMDMYSVSAYPKDPNHKDAWSDELKKGRERIKKLAEIFPEQDIMESNHDDRAYKKSRVAGVPREFLIPYRDVIGAPEGWKWYRTLTLTVDSTREHILFAHTAAGGALSTAKAFGKTVVLGHQHTLQGVVGFKPTKKKTIWGVDTGCLVSDKGSPFSYNKAFRGRPMTGCVIIEGGIPRIIKLG